LVVTTRAHDPRRFGPTGTRASGRTDDQPALLRLQFDFVWQLCLFQQHLRQADAFRVSDPDNPCSYDHVITV